MAELSSDQLFELAVTHHQAGRLAKAEEIYRKIVATQPDYFLAWNNLGIVLRSQRKLAEAIAAYERALILRPEAGEIHNNFGNALEDAGRHAEATESFRQALRLKPNFGDACANLARALQKSASVDDSIAEFRRLIALQPQFYEAFHALGIALWAKGEMKEASEVFGKAVALRPELPQAWINYGNTLQEIDKAMAAFHRVLELQPDHADTYHNLGNLLMTTGEPARAVESYRKAVDLRPDFRVAHSHLLFALHFDPGTSPKEILKEHLIWNERHGRSTPQITRPRADLRDPDRKLRIGYISSDFNQHVVGRNVLPLLREHDHTHFEIFCYYNMPVEDDFTRQFRGYSNGWRKIAQEEDDQVAQMIREDKTDILVDLALHMRGSRLGIFAQKPAPLQVTFARYPSTTGVAAIDYRLTDPWLDPVGNDVYYSEKSIRLPDSFWCYDEASMELSACPDITPLPVLANGYITFGCLNNFCKVNDRVLDLWAKVLQLLPHSRLVLLSMPGEHRQRVVDRLGVEIARVDFLQPRPRKEYFEFYHNIDIGLDTFPYNGHTTSLDSFWMGVPVVSRIGPSAVSRAAYSQASNLGLATVLVGQSADEFVRLAIDLANDLPRLGRLRSELRERMKASPLMDAKRFARNIESAYRKMWFNWCQAKN